MEKLLHFARVLILVLSLVTSIGCTSYRSVQETKVNQPERLVRKILFSADGPVYVYDSIPESMNPHLVPPNDIKSIDVIKDHEETIKRFGPNGKNGVIIITLKKKLHGK